MRKIIYCCIAVLSGCANFSPQPASIVGAMQAAGCAPRSVETTDTFNPRLIGVASSRTTRVDCQTTEGAK